MSSEWEAQTVGDVAVFENRFRIPLSAAQRAERPGPYPYWGANGPFDTIDDFLFDGARVLVAEDGNTVVRRDGRGTVHRATGHYWVNNHAHVLNVQDGYDLRWLFYALSHAHVRDFVTGSAQPKLSMGSLKRLPLRAPPCDEQRRIASVLGALDDKIESNQRMVTILHDTAEALFAARYIDFVGVDELESSPIGPIPRGWRVLPFSDAVEINPRVRIPKGEMRPFIEMAAVAPWATRPGRIAQREAAGGCKYEPGDTLMARITGCIEHGKGTFLDFIEECGTGSTEFLVLRAKPPLTPEAVFFLSRWEKLRAHAIANMTGSSGRQRVAVSCFDDFDVAVPPHERAVGDVAEFLAAAMRRSLAVWRETMMVTAIRDELLPKLVSGEIRVSADGTEVGDGKRVA